MGSNTIFYKITQILQILFRKNSNVEHTNMNADSEVDFLFGSVSDFETFDRSQ